MSNRIINISTLSVISGSEGEQVFVDTVKSPWRHHKGARLPVDSITVQIASDGYQWVRNEYHHPEWLSRAIWHIDFNSGNDEADGYTLGTAIKTFAELLRRLGDDFTPQQDVDIYCHGDNLVSDPLRIFGWRIITPIPTLSVRRVKFHGSTTTYYTGTFTAIQAMNRATNTPFVITDTNMIGSNQSPPIGVPNNNVYWYNPIPDPFGTPRATNRDFQRLRISSGPRVNAVSWTAAANLSTGGFFGSGANGAIRTSNWLIPDPLNFGTTAIIPQVGDHYVVEKLSKLYVDHVEITGNDDSFGAGLFFYDFDIYLTHGYDSQQVGNQNHWVAAGGSLTWTNCFHESVVAVSNISAGSYTYSLNSAALDSYTITSGFYNYLDGGLVHLGIIASEGATLILDAAAMVETGTLGAITGGTLAISDACSFDQPGHGLKAGVFAGGGNFPAPGTVFVSSGNLYGISALWGNDPTGTRSFGVNVQDGGRFVIDPLVNKANITITGINSDFCIGMSDKNGNRASGINSATKTLTSPRNCSWDNLFNKTIAQGGFDGRVVDLETMSFIGPLITITDQTSSGGPIIYVDPVNGIDHNDGYTSVTAIKTNVELATRLSAFPITTNFDVYYLSYPPSSDPLRLNLRVEISSAGKPIVNFHAPALSTKTSGTFSAVTTRTRSTNTPWKVTDGVVNTTTDPDLRIRISGGARVNARAWVAKSTGSGERRTSEWGQYDVSVGGTTVTPQVGDPYVIEQVSGTNKTLPIDYIRVQGGSESLAFLSPPMVTFDSFDFDSALAGGEFPIENLGGVILNLLNCRFVNFTVTINTKPTSASSGRAYTYFLNCNVREAFFAEGTGTSGIENNFVDGGLVTAALTAVRAGGVIVDFDCLAQGAAFGAFDGGHMKIGSAGVMDTPSFGGVGAAFEAQDGLIRVQNTFYGYGGALWGVSAVANTRGVEARDGGSVRYDDSTKLTVTGAAGDFSVGGQSSANAFNAAAGTWTAPIACTWANLSVSLLDNAQYPPANARIYKNKIAG